MSDLPKPIGMAYPEVWESLSEETKRWALKFLRPGVRRERTLREQWLEDYAEAMKQLDDEFPGVQTELVDVGATNSIGQILIWRP